MNILKALLLTLLLIIIFSLPQAGVYYLLEWVELKNETISKHIYFPMIMSFLIAYLTIFYFFWKPRPGFKTVINFNKLKVSLIPSLLIIVIGFGFAGQPFWDIEKIFHHYQDSSLKPLYEYHFKLTPYFFYHTFTTLVIAPIFEELFFRKFLFKKLLQKNNLNLSIIISSLCFALIHFETPDNLIPTFFAGVISCLIYYKTKRIEYSIILHFSNNLLVSIFNIFGESYFTWLYDLKFDFTYWTLFVFGILVIILGVKKTIQTLEKSKV